ncbi:MAG: SLC26A/SulP transporter family protein [Symploca sp. SIO2E6]|nr:SLC26A/SulP transporter family protein [Symploca sp. SIO2E6]
MPWLKEFKPLQLIASVTAGLVVGAIGVTMSISYAALIFSGNLAPYLATGIGISLFSAAIICLVVAVMSSSPAGIIAMPLPPTVAVLALMAADISGKMPDQGEVTFSTVIGAIAVTSLLSGVFLLTLGWLKAGQLIRFIPYPVIGGFLAGIGWLLTKGGIQVTTGISISISNLPSLFQSELLLRWLPGLVFALVLLLIMRRYQHFLIVPIALVTAISLFYAILLVTNTSITQASAQGWLLGPFPEGNAWQPLGLQSLTQAKWSLIVSQIGSMGTIMAINTLQLLLTATSLELITDREINLNQELRGAGIANLLSGMGGGMVGSHLTSLCVLVCKMGASSRRVGICTAAVFAGMLVFGISLLSFFPKVVLGGFLLFLGCSFLVEWLYDAWFKLPKTEYFLVLVILLVIGTAGFLEGVGVGLIVATILFAINYSQINVTKHVLSGANHHSHVQRPQNQERLLQQKGQQIYILQLQGLIFFGTANQLLNQISEQLIETKEPPLRFVVLDFRQVTGLDSSAVVSFAKLKQMARKQQLKIVLTNLPLRIEQQLQKGKVLQSSDPIYEIFLDLDRGLEWCENQILEASKLRRRRFVPLVMQLQGLFVNEDEVPNFMNYLSKVQLAEGDYLFHQGDKPDELYFLESGQVSTFVEVGSGQRRRVQTLGPGTMVGEIEFHTQSCYQISAIADQSSKVYQLSTVELKKMQEQHPETALAFSELALSLLAHRLAQAHREIDTLMS